MSESHQHVSPNASFHAGELIAQQKTGVLEKMAEIGPRAIRDFMPDQHRQFFEHLPFIVVGSQDEAGQPWASLLVGRQPGFIASPTDRQLNIRAAAHASDPLHDNLRHGASIGLLGIQPHTRRRNRANGLVTDLTDAGFSIAITQSFGNCPRYIQARESQPIESETGLPTEIETSARLTTPMRALIARSDTFFIATAFSAEARRAGSRHGVDVSHRGGKPGFVRVDGNRLTVPDFDGNAFFNTIGNLLTHPRAGLLFVDFSNGDLLYLAVTAEVVWSGDEVAAYGGAQRVLRLEVTQARHVRAAAPLRWTDAVQSPFLQATGSWT